MLNFSTVTEAVGQSTPAHEAEADPGIDFGKLLRAGRRQMWIILLFCMLGFLAGIAYLGYTTPRYTATTVVFIDSAKDKSGLAASIADLTYDAGAIDSQLEVLKSEGVAHAVISNLKLDADDPSLRPARGMISRFTDSVKTMFGMSIAEEPKPNAEEQRSRQRSLISQLQSNLDVRRIGRSYVINIDYTTTDPVEAARLSNGFAEAYIGDQLESRFDSMRRASGWLEKRISELKQKSMDADLAVQEFKAANGILTSDGKLVSEQQLSELSTQFVIAKSERARAEARYAQIESLIAQNKVTAVVSDTLSSSVINDLRQKYMESASLEAQISSSLGGDHPQAVRLRKNMSDLSNLMFDELSRVAAAYRSDAEVARAREVSLQQSLTSLAAKSAETNEAMVQLREMQREAESFKTLYSTFLQRLQQVQERQSFPGSEARIITPASPPSGPSYPKRFLSMTLCLFFGALAGIAIGTLRERQDRSFRTASDVRDGLHIDLIGILPSIPHAGPRGALSLGPRLRMAASTFGDRFRRGRVVDMPREVRALDERLPPVTESRQVHAMDPALRHVMDSPFTNFAETLRGAKVVVDIQVGDQVPKVVGFVSVSPGEGKSTLSKNFASLAARLGAKVLLIDGDLHHPGLTQALASTAPAGLLEVIRGERKLEEVVLYEPDSGLYFLPAIVKTRLVHASQMLSSSGMRKLLDDAGTRFEYIVVDLPPIGPVVDVRAASAMFDVFVLVLHWGHTLRDLVQSTLKSEPDIATRIVGAVYNDVPIDKIRLYEGADEKAFHHEAFGKYY